MSDASDQRIYDRCIIRVGQLEAENAKLREQAGRLFDKTLELATENARLRELVHDSVSLLSETCDTYYEEDYHSIVERARELGV